MDSVCAMNQITRLGDKSSAALKHQEADRRWEGWERDIEPCYLEYRLNNPICLGRENSEMCVGTPLPECYACPNPPRAENGTWGSAVWQVRAAHLKPKRAGPLGWKRAYAAPSPNTA